MNGVLRRPRFDRYLREEERIEFLASLVRESDLVEVTEVVNACRDPNDNKFLELAVSGAATHIISGDDDLLVLHPFRGIAVLSAQDFLEQETKLG